MFPQTIAWKDNKVVILAQRRLRAEDANLEYTEAAIKIKGLSLRGYNGSLHGR